MKLALALVFISAVAAASHGHGHEHRGRCENYTTSTRSNGSNESTGWRQKPHGRASFTAYNGCQYPSCGIRMKSGYTAAVNTLSFGADDGAGDACGRCFEITPTSDPYTPSYKGPFGNTIVVKVTDLCPITSGNNAWCGQTISHPRNQHNMSMHFDLCNDSGSSSAFFPGRRGAMLGTYQEVDCQAWSGASGDTLWNGACLARETAALWPSHACGNRGTPPN
ncbi:endoglucanase V-like protein [Russula earlei]|uniref:Endoglucanase V-like protein n=1 Tax=Russula earlei TaxID=71964 RepID=A0ACC0UGT6_9AGAM|nr:endoglucanase V-like protein [Russula earlei]